MPPRATHNSIPPEPGVNGHPKRLHNRLAGVTGPPPPVPEEPELCLDLNADAGRTDIANAGRLVRSHGEDLRFVVEWGQWVVWDDRRWERDVGGIRVLQRAVQTSKSLWGWMATNTPTDQRRVTSHIQASNSAKGVANMVTLARGMLPARVVSLDTDPWLLNCPNGTLDLRTGELRPHSRGDYVTKLCPTAYNPRAKCPAWGQFLKDVLREDEELIAFLQRVLGYGLTGDVREQILPILWGAEATVSPRLSGRCSIQWAASTAAPRLAPCSRPAGRIVTRRS